LAATHRAGAQIAVVVIGYLVVDPLLGALLMPLTVRIVAPQVASEAVSMRVQQLAAEAQVKIRRPRIVRSRERRLANALQVGWLPGLKYIVIYDYLVDEMSAPQRDAIIAHELAHARLRHAIFRTFGSWILITAAALILVDVVSGWHNEIVTVGGFAVVILAGRSLRSLALRQETAADDFAARIAGPAALASALERLTELNALSANTSAKWDRQVGHPGMAKRIARLQAQQLAAVPDAVAGSAS
jgi:Zn-dependent protease with chaperone function